MLNRENQSEAILGDLFKIAGETLTVGSTGYDHSGTNYSEREYKVLSTDGDHITVQYVDTSEKKQYPLKVKQQQNNDILAQKKYQKPNAPRLRQPSEKVPEIGRGEALELVGEALGQKGLNPVPIRGGFRLEGKDYNVLCRAVKDANGVIWQGRPGWRLSNNYSRDTIFADFADRNAVQLYVVPSSVIRGYLDWWMAMWRHEQTGFDWSIMLLDASGLESTVGRIKGDLGAGGDVEIYESKAAQYGPGWLDSYKL